MGRDIRESHPNTNLVLAQNVQTMLACIWIITLHTFASRGQ